VYRLPSTISVRSSNCGYYT